MENIENLKNFENVEDVETMFTEIINEDNEEVVENLDFDVAYAPIKTEEVYIDQNQSVITQDDLQITPLDVIKAHAEQLGIELVDPKSSCKSCYGRGYIGRDSQSKAPIPCSCIQVDFNSVNNQTMYNRTRKLSRKERRQLDKDNRKRAKRG